VTKIKFVCISKHEKYRSGRVTVMRFNVFGELKKIRNEHFCLLAVVQFVWPFIANILAHSVPAEL